MGIPIALSESSPIAMIRAEETMGKSCQLSSNTKIVCYFRWLIKCSHNFPSLSWVSLGPFPMTVVVASGPWTTSDNLNYKPLQDFITEMVKNPPHVLILVLRCFCPSKNYCQTQPNFTSWPLRRPNVLWYRLWKFQLWCHSPWTHSDLATVATCTSRTTTCHTQIEEKRNRGKCLKWRAIPLFLFCQVGSSIRKKFWQIIPRKTRDPPHFW